MQLPEGGQPPLVAVASRTLIIAGYTIENSQRLRNHIEYYCEKRDQFGTGLRYLFALTDQDAFSELDLRAISASALRLGRYAVCIASDSGSDWLSWSEFTGLLGGEVPSWEALTDTYGDFLQVASRNDRIPEDDREPWRVFEELVAGGLEFIFGRRTIRLGGRRRGQMVSDIQAQLPSGQVLIVDTKAASQGFDVGWPELRPLVEYTRVEKRRQSGHVDIQSAVVVSSEFVQGASRLTELSREFLAATTVPVTFLTASTLLHCIECLRDKPRLRRAVDWRRLLSGGPFEQDLFDAEFAEAGATQVEP